MREGWRFVVCGLGLMMTGLAGVAQVGPLRVTSAPVASTPEEKEKPETPLVFYTGEGRFEIIAIKAEAAQEALIVANSVWRALSRPIGLPAGGFSSPVAVRLVPAKDWKEPAVFTVVSEPGGRVGVRIRWDDKLDTRIMRRALVQAVLLRQAVSWYGASPKLAVPLWLEQACTGLTEIRDRPAIYDAMQQESAHLAPPPLEGLLSWQRGEPEPRGWQLASFWLFQYLQSESADTPRWGKWLQANLSGAGLMESLKTIYGATWKDPAGRELWWQVGFYSESLSSELPLMSMEATRDWLADRCRWLALIQWHEQVLSLDDLWTFRREPWVKADLSKRAEQLQSQLPRLHPFYRNAAISMGRMYQAALKGDEKEFKDAKKALSQDAVDGRELENETGAALDALESKR